MSSESFLSRWSKRKQEARKVEQTGDDRPATQAEPAESDRAPETIRPSEAHGLLDATEAELSAEEIAALPSIDELTVDTDISVFLRKGVPEPLRNAALRRMWSLDPKIRDFVSEAREYAYDWNIPGGVPGFGPLEASEDVARMAARIVGGGVREPDDADRPTRAADNPSQDREQASSDRVQEPELPDPAPAAQDVAAVPTSPGRAADGTNVIASPSSLRDERQQSGASAAQPLSDIPANGAPARRHGGALPV